MLEHDKSFQRQSKFVVLFLFVVFLGLAFYGAVKYALPLLLPFVIAFLLAFLLQKPLKFLTEKTHIKKGFWAAVIVLLAVTAVGYVLFLAFSKIYAQLEGLSQYLISKLDDIPEFLKEVEKTVLDLAHVIPDRYESTATTSINDFFNDLLQKYQDMSGSNGTEGSFNLKDFVSNLDIAWIKTPLNGVWDMAKRVPMIIVGIVLTVVATIFTATDWQRLVGFIKRQLPEDKRNALTIAKRSLTGTVGKLLLSYIALMGITFTEMLISMALARAFGVLDSDFWIAVAFIVAVVDILPVLGTGSVVVPWAIVSFATDKTGLGIWLLVTYAVITVVRQYLEPKLVANNLGLPPVLTLAGMYVGTQLFGFVGMVLVPVSLMLLKVLNDEGVIRLWKPNENRARPLRVRHAKVRKAKKLASAGKKP